MKRATREWAKSQIELQREMRTHGDRYFVDILDSDKKQRATIKDLKARLKAALALSKTRFFIPMRGDDAVDMDRILDLSNKKWRAGK